MVSRRTSSRLGLVALAAVPFLLPDARAVAVPEGPAPAGEITVVATGLRGEGESVRLALVSTPAAFEDREAPLKTAAARIAGGTARLVLEDVPYGDYALMLYQDRNGNGKLDPGFLGMPKEPYGFSNNVRSPTGRPPFEKARFTLRESRLTLEVRLK